MIKAIETRYKGCHFRSRLEARWAVFFDYLDWDWKYEHEGYVIGPFEETRAWLPDFEITTPKGQHFYVEVKGDPDFFKDGEWVNLLDWGGGPPGFDGSGYPPAFSSGYKPIVLLGDVPYSQDCAVALYVTVLLHAKGMRSGLAVVSETGLTLSDWLDSVDCVPDFQAFVRDLPNTRSNAVGRALTAARSARFEHGQSGAT